MKNNLCKLALLGLVLQMNISFIYPQITIGSDLSPLKGAILQLKQNDSLQSNSTKGLGMPRMELLDMNNLYPMFTSGGPGKYSLNGEILDKAGTDIEHTGLVIYNTLEFVFNKKVVCPGLYVWDGEEWQSLSPIKTIENDNFVYDKQNNRYNIGNFGDAGIWMTQNLRVTVTPCGTPLTESANPSMTSMNYYYPNKDRDLYTKHKEYGLLYNWAATTLKKGGEDGTQYKQSEGEGATNEEERGTQGICPFGWHIPSDKEWNELEKAIFENPMAYSSNTFPGEPWLPEWNTATNWRGDKLENEEIKYFSMHGSCMKSQTPIDISGATNENGMCNPAGSNGFDAYLVGRIISNSSVENFAAGVHFWTSSSSGNNGTTAWRRYLGGVTTRGVARLSGGTRQTLQSVRCKKD